MCSHHSPGATKLKFGICAILLGATLAVLLSTCCQSLRRPVSVSDLVLIPGQHSLLYERLRPKPPDSHPATLGRLFCVSWDTDGAIAKSHLCSLQTIGQRFLPRFVVSDTPGPYHFSGFQWSWRLGEKGVKSCIWEVSPEKMTCREILCGDWRGEFFCNPCYNKLEGKFAAMIIDMESGPRKQEIGPYIVVSEDTGDWREMSFNAGFQDCFLTSGGGIVWTPAADDSEHLHGSLYLDDMVVAKGVDELLGITPDASKMFYSSNIALDGATTATLWAYDIEAGKAGKLLDWVGDIFRVGGRSDRFGFVLIEKGPRRPNLPGCVKIIESAKVFSIEGQLIEEFDLQEPIHAGVCDWDVDLMEIVYYDETRRKIVIQKLGGEIIASFTP